MLNENMHFLCIVTIYFFNKQKPSISHTTIYTYIHILIRVSMVQIMAVLMYCIYLLLILRYCIYLLLPHSGRDKWPIFGADQLTSHDMNE